MIKSKRFEVGSEPVNLAQGTGSSGVKLLRVRNESEHPVWLGEAGSDGEGWSLKNGDSTLDGIELTPQDSLELVGDPDADEPQIVRVLMSYDDVGLAR